MHITGSVSPFAGIFAAQRAVTSVLGMLVITNEVPICPAAPAEMQVAA